MPIGDHLAVKRQRNWGREAAVGLTVAASVRHIDTDYDDLLMSGVDRDDARRQVRDRVAHVLDTWRDATTVLDT